MTFQRKVGRKLRELGLNPEVEPWFEFETAAGVRRCAPDFVLLDPLTVFEVKLTQWAAGWEQLRKYEAVLSAAFGTTPRLVMVTRNLNGHIIGNLILDPRDAAPGLNTWHFL